MSEPNKAIQEEELEALRAIFADDWHDIPPKKTAWGTASEGGWWEVKLKGREDDRVSVTLRGKLTKKYPHQPPPLSLVEPNYLTVNHIQALTKLLNDEARAKVGEQMIYDLADTVIDWITANHMRLPKPGDPPNLMEELARREEAQRAVEAAQNYAAMEEQRARDEEENRKLTEKIQLNTSQKQEKAQQAVLNEAERQRQQILATLADGELEDRHLALEKPISVDGFTGSFLSWMLFGGTREPLWTSYTAEPDVGAGFVRASLPSLTVQVVDFSKSYYSTAPGRKRIDVMLVELNRLKLLSSKHVIKFYGTKIDKTPKGWERVFILLENVTNATRLDRWMPREGFTEDAAKTYIEQILIGLADVHKRGDTQKQLDLENIVVCASSTEPIVKLAGTSYVRRIIDMHKSNPFLSHFASNTPESWLSPDEIDSPHSYTAKRDMWHAGLIIVQLLFGANCLWRYPNLQILIQSVSGISDHMMDLLSGLFHLNPKKRLTAEEALQRLRADDMTRKSSSWSGKTAAISITSPTLSEVNQMSPTKTLSTYFNSAQQSRAPHMSRYRTDFEEVEFLGKGGFGEVVKARNRLDGRSYAIKKVKLRPEDNENKVYREVNSLSRVSHHHIVRYYGCWLEDITPIASQTPTQEPSSNGTGSTPQIKDPISDIFATNFDDLSISRSKSTSFPQIRFANDDEEDDEDSDDSDDTDSSGAETAADPSQLRDRHQIQPVDKPMLKPSLSVTDTTDASGDVQRILYIQMEFVEKQTLREAINQGLTEEEVWQLLVQILQALSHMHSLGIVHRDLKPSNILLDASGNVKVADFGLSTNEMTALETTTTTHQAGDTSERTSGIGTGLYIAPEVAISRSYNEKADMYSLGVIFFEMCFAFKTGMERISMLQTLRQPAITFPQAWSASVKPNQAELIRGLLRHDPNARPTAMQILSSPLLPSPERQKEFYDSAIAEITNPRSSQYPHLIDALFDTDKYSYSASTDNRIDDYTYDNDIDTGYQVWQTVVVTRLIDLFQRHGAVETFIPLLVPETSLLTAFPDLTTVRLLDRNGKIVQLPSSGILSMARTAARRGIERIKRYRAGDAYSDHPAGGQPRAIGQLNFDIISPIRSTVAEAELLDVIDNVISELRGMRGSYPVDYEFHISHESILSIILASIPSKCRQAFLKILKNSGSGTSTANIRAQLSAVAGLPKQAADELEQCFVTDDFAIVRSKLETLFPSYKTRLSSVFDTLSSVIDLTRASGISRKILFRPTLSRNAEFFRGGFMFECVRRGKQRDVIAFGGRYDSLLEHFKEPAQRMQSRKVYGVAMTIMIDSLAKMVRVYESALSERLMNKDNDNERSFGFWSPARCDVYVAAVTQVDISARLGILGELWRAGLRADLQYDDGRTLEEVLTECLEQNILYLVIPRANRPTIKIRSILKRSEDEIPRNELCQYLRHAIAEQRRVDASYATAEGSMPSAQAAALSVEPRAGSTSDAEIRLILPPEPTTSKGTKGRPVRKHRHATKAVYYDKAQDFATSTGTSLPLVGVDLPVSQLAQLCVDASWLYDDEVWRGILSSIPTGERRYVESVKEGILEMGKSGQRSGMMWLFSVREGKGFLLQPSK